MSVGMDVITGVQMLCISESVPVPEESYCWVLSSLEGLRETTGKGTCPGLAWVLLILCFEIHLIIDV